MLALVYVLHCGYCGCKRLMEVNIIIGRLKQPKNEGQNKFLSINVRTHGKEYPTTK